MKIFHRLILSFLVVVTIVGIIGYFGVITSQNALQESITAHAAALAVKTLDEIDRDIHSRIEVFQEYCSNLILLQHVLESNREFAEIDNIQAYIDTKDKEWTSVSKEEITPFMRELMSNRLSQELKERTTFYEAKYNYKLFGEVFVTNKFGANIAQTGKTTDYRQDDEQWWQEAKSAGLYVSDVEYDESADVYSTDICIRIDDNNGAFVGVIKVILNIEETINIIRELKQHKRSMPYKEIHFDLIARNGRSIYSTRDYSLFEDASHLLRDIRDREVEGFYHFQREGNEPGEGQQLSVWAHSRGYRDFDGLGWILMINYATEEIFIPVDRLRNRMLTVTLSMMVFAILIGYFVSRSIAKPILSLSATAAQIGKGKLDSKIEVTSSDEVGQLAVSFKEMTEGLKKSTTSIEKLNKEIARRKQAEKALQKAYDGLELRVEERTYELAKANERLKQEIEERKRTEEALRESENKYHDLYDNAPDMYVSVDAKTAKIIECNQTLIDRLGYTREEIIGRPVFDMYSPDSAEFSRRKMFPEFVKKGKIEGEELQLQRKDGTTVDVYLKASAVRDPEGKVLYSISSWRDITEKKKLEAQLQHAQKLESLGTLTSGVAHNFRNLLTPISLYSQFLQMMYKDDPQLQEMAEKTGECVKRGAQLVDGLMHFCRKHTKEIETINLAEVIRETYDLITESFDKKIDILMDIDDSILIRGNRSELSQVFMNLCTNARDAMSDGGELRIEASIEGDNAVIIISDTGPGMDEQTREQCFDPFFTTKEVDKGTGLGLSTTYGIVKDHGGEIHVFSGLNKGTIFKLDFPLALSDEYQKQAGVHEIVQGSGEKILIIDDETDILEVLVMLAEQLGYSAASADSGKAGINKYKSWRPDVVLLDRNMPGMDGLECARSILEHDLGARIVLISGYDEGGPSGIDDKTKALIKGYLTKPINMEEVSQTIRKVLDKD